MSGDWEVCQLFVSSDVLSFFVQWYFLIKFTSPEKDGNIEITRTSFRFVTAKIS